MFVYYGIIACEFTYANHDDFKAIVGIGDAFARIRIVGHDRSDQTQNRSGAADYRRYST